jgi:hypothetical protein
VVGVGIWYGIANLLAWLLTPTQSEVSAKDVKSLKGTEVRKPVYCGADEGQVLVSL